MTGIAPTTVPGPGLELRPWRTSDADAVFRACQDPDIARWTGIPTPYLREHTDGLIEHSAAQWAEGRPGFAIAEPDAGPDDDVLGSIGFVRTPGPGVLEVGYWISPWARRRGVATAALGTVCDWAFDVHPDLVRIEWQAFAGNAASWRVAERCGFVREGTLRLRARRFDVAQDAEIASLLRDDPRPPVRPVAPAG